MASYELETSIVIPNSDLTSDKLCYFTLLLVKMQKSRLLCPVILKGGWALTYKRLNAWSAFQWSLQEANI